MNKNNAELVEPTIDIERLLFRRQFFLGPQPFTPNQYWSCTQFKHGLHLSIHVDLPFCSVTEQDLTVTLIGIAIDPFHPQANEVEILRDLIADTPDPEVFIESTMPITGRWVILFQNNTGSYLFTDPCGFRQVFYHTDEKTMCCASQPELIKANRKLHLNSNPALMPFLTDPAHARRESLWIGPSTLYEQCLHLMPNHYLNVNHADQIRFYPKITTGCRTTSETIQSASTILRGTITGLAKRYNLNLALTAGVDSRVLLAASRHVRNEIDYFVYRQKTFKDDHPDIRIPKEIAAKLGLSFNVKTPDHHLPGWFVSMLSHNITCARVLPKTCNIYNKLITGDTKININGNASEICRNFFDKFCKLDAADVSTTKLTSIILGRDQASAFAHNEINEWGKRLPCSSFDEGLNILDFLYWEQRLGNWGAQYPAEQDIAVEEISPFNCRLLIQTLATSPRHMRAAPDFPLYRLLIEKMWPEVLAFPINPKPKNNSATRIKQKIRSYVPQAIVRTLKKVLKP